jgi:hypothetical protein
METVTMTSTYHDDDSMMQKNESSVFMCVPTEITICHDEQEEASYLTGMAFYKQGQVCPILLLHDTDGEMLHRVYTQDKSDFVDLRGREALGQFCKGLFEYDQTLRFKVVSSLP